MHSAAEGQANVDKAIALSPMDPLRYGMLGTRAFSHLILGEDGEAATWADKAANSPGAHVLIELIAAVAHQLNGDAAKAEKWATSVRRKNPGLTTADFFRAFPLQDPAARARLFGALNNCNFG